jgi:hypothetical protein
MCDLSQKTGRDWAKSPGVAPPAAPIWDGMRAMYFYPITGVGILQPGQAEAGWAVAGVLLLLMALV